MQPAGAVVDVVIFTGGSSNNTSAHSNSLNLGAAGIGFHSYMPHEVCCMRPAYCCLLTKHGRCCDLPSVRVAVAAGCRLALLQHLADPSTTQPS